MTRTILILAVMLLCTSVQASQWLNNAFQLLQPAQPIGYNNNQYIQQTTYPYNNGLPNVNQTYYQNQYPNQFVSQYPTQYQNQSQYPNAYQYQNPYYNTNYGYGYSPSTTQLPYTSGNGIKNQLIKNVCQSLLYSGTNGN